MTLTRTVDPTVYPVSRNDMKRFLRVETDEDNALIDALIKTATNMCEKRTHRSLQTQTWKLSIDNYPGRDYIELPNAIIKSIVSVTSYGIDDTPTVLDASQYYLTDPNMKGKLTLTYNGQWPSITLRPRDGVEIIYTAGYGDTPDDVPFELRHGIKNMVGALYENRELPESGIPAMVTKLWSLYKVWDV